MMDDTPKELCDLGVCTSRSEARMLLPMIAEGDHQIRVQSKMIEAQRKRIAELEAELGVRERRDRKGSE